MTLPAETQSRFNHRLEEVASAMILEAERKWSKDTGYWPDEKQKGLIAVNCYHDAYEQVKKEILMGRPSDARRT